MRFELFLFLVTAFIVGNVYTDGRWFAWVLSGKKYFQIAAILFGAVVLYWTFRRDPRTSRLTASAVARRSAELIKYLPIDTTTTGMIHPILDFTGRYGDLPRQMFEDADPLHPVVTLDAAAGGPPRAAISARIHRRSVSETRKKHVAASQQWRCAGHGCAKMLSAYYEIDHVIPLEHGGSNEIDNLVALCRECHAKKTYPP